MIFFVKLIQWTDRDRVIDCDTLISPINSNNDSLMKADSVIIHEYLRKKGEAKRYEK